MSVAAPRGRRERFPRLIVQLLMSYAIIVSLGVGFFIIPAQNTVRMLREQTRADQTTAVTRFARSADSVLSLLSNIATGFLTDNAMFNLAHGRAGNPNLEYYDIHAQLVQYNKLYGNIFDQIYMYDSHSGNLLSVTGLSKSSMHYEDRLSAYMARGTYDRLLERGIPRAPDLFAEGRTAYVVHTLPFNYPDDRHISISFSIPLQNLFSFSSKHEQTPDAFGIYLTETGEFLGDADARFSPLIEQGAQALDSSSVSIQDMPGEGSIFLIRSARNDRYYYFVMPQSAYNNQVASFSRFQVFSLIGFLAVSIAIILFSVWQQYRPLKRLLDEIDRDSIDALSTRDYGMILNYLAGLKKERDGYKNLFIDRNPRLRRLLLSALVTDTTLTEDKAEESLRLLEIDFPHPFCAVIVIDILDDSELFFSRTEDPETYSAFLIENVLGDLLPEDAGRAFLEIDDSLVCVLNLAMEDSPQATLLALQDKLLFAADFLMRELNLTCRYAVSSLHRGKGAFADAYFEALECAKNPLPQEAFVMLYDFMPVKEEQSFVYLQPYSADQAKRLVAALRGAHPSRAQAIVREAFSAAKDSADLHPLVYRSMCRSMVASLVEAMVEMNAASESLEKRLSDLLDADTQALPPKIMAERIAGLCRDIAEQIQSQEGGRQERLVADINAYVNGNYADAGLGVTGIAEVFAMSVSSLSGFYGRNSDVGLCKYINRVRIGHACRLLRENPGMPLDEVAQRVGYSNTRTFSRVFSAEMQVSPGKYRAGE